MTGSADPHGRAEDMANDDTVGYTDADSSLEVDPGEARHAADPAETGDDQYSDDEYVEDQRAVDDGDGNDEVEVQWANRALDVQAFVDDDDPHSSFLQILVFDTEGDLGMVQWPLGAINVRELQHQLEDVRGSQELALWIADGNDPELFPGYASAPAGAADGPVDDYVELDDDDADDDDADEVRTGDQRPVFQRVSDPMAIRLLMEKAPTLFGVQAHYWLIAAAVVVFLGAMVWGWVT